jgi:colicin import membrane protein
LAVKRNIAAPEISGNPVAVVKVNVERDGRIIARELVSSSGVKEWDAAVLLAVDKTQRLPVEPNEYLPPVIEFAFRPR